MHDSVCKDFYLIQRKLDVENQRKMNIACFIWAK